MPDPYLSSFEEIWRDVKNAARTARRERWFWKLLCGFAAVTVLILFTAR